MNNAMILEKENGGKAIVSPDSIAFVSSLYNTDTNEILAGQCAIFLVGMPTHLTVSHSVEEIAERLAEVASLDDTRNDYDGYTHNGQPLPEATITRLLAACRELRDRVHANENYKAAVAAVVLAFNVVDVT